MSADKKRPSGPDEEAEVIDMEAAWGPYLTDAARDAADAGTWDLAQVRVWPAGAGGPTLPVPALAAWRAEEGRMMRALAQQRAERAAPTHDD